MSEENFESAAMNTFSWLKHKEFSLQIPRWPINSPYQISKHLQNILVGTSPISRAQQSHVSVEMQNLRRAIIKETTTDTTLIFPPSKLTREANSLNLKKPLLHQIFTLAWGILWLGVTKKSVTKYELPYFLSLFLKCLHSHIFLITSQSPSVWVLFVCLLFLPILLPHFCLEKCFPSLPFCLLFSFLIP